MTNVCELLIYNKCKVLQNTMNAVIDLRIPQLRTRIFSVIQKKQNGKCHRCKINITLSDTVVSNGNGRGYYHNIVLRNYTSYKFENVLKKLGRVFIVCYLFTTTRIFWFIWFRFWLRFYLTNGSSMLIQFVIVWIHCIIYGNNKYLRYILISGEQSVSIIPSRKKDSTN